MSEDMDQKDLLEMQLKQLTAEMELLNKIHQKMLELGITDYYIGDPIDGSDIWYLSFETEE